MKYVKLIAKPDTWFKAGSEVWHYDEHRRLTLEEWNEWFKSGIALVSGIHVSERDELDGDGELCTCDEFDVEIVDMPV